MSNLNVENRTLYHGDNLPFLRNLNSESVHLIATDPPFNKNKDFHATPDSLAAGASFQDRWSWERDVHQEWVDQITDDFPKLMEAIESARFAHSDGMGAFMCFMAVRLLEMRRILRKDGSIYLHCDPTASHYLKAIMDAIYGHKNFRNEIIWRRTGAHGRAKKWGPIHDCILLYTKSGKYIWNRIYEEYDQSYIDNFYKFSDERGQHRLVTLDGPGIRHGSSGQQWRGVNPTNKGRHWEIPPNRALPKNFKFPEGYSDMSCQERLDVLDEAGLIYWPPKGKVPQHKRYLANSEGNPIQDIINDIRPIGSQASERLGYPTQKPLALLERIIKASSNEGDVVLDPFCGCATTLVAGEQLKRQWIGADIWNKAHEVVIERLKEDGGIKNNLFETKSIIYTKELPERTDDGYDAVPFMKTKLKKKRNPEPWQLLSRKDIVNELIQAQSINDLVICAGCGRELEPEFMELDHIKPKVEGGENDISNRILLCRPCNGKKRDRFTMRGLINENKKSGWLKDVEKARIAKELALKKSEEIRYGDD